jgi:hypothetical protein
MSARPWDGFLTPADGHLLETTEPRPRRGFGDSVAVLLVDDPAVAALPHRVADRIAAVTTAAHTIGIPVFHSTARTAHADETVLDASSPSAFFGTPLIALLTARRIDTVIVCGATVSGRIRATVVDAFSYGLLVVLAEDCVFDPFEAAGALGMFDIARSYADVLSSAEIIGQLLGEVIEHDHGRDHGHDHRRAHRHEHGHGSDSPPAVTALPAAVLAALPPGAVPNATIHHPIHGHVLQKAGDSVLLAATDAIAQSFGTTPHIVVTLREHEVGDPPELREALAQTSGGVLLVGVGFDAADDPARTLQRRSAANADPEPTAPGPVSSEPHGGRCVDSDEACPECGAPAARVERAPESGTGQEVLLYVCDDCGAAWDV